MFLTYHKGIATITDQHPPRTEDGEIAEGVTVLTVEKGLSKKAARRWFERMKRERPWEERN